MIDIYCEDCKRHTEHSKKTTSNVCSECSRSRSGIHTLIRESDGDMHTGTSYRFLEFEGNKGKELHKDIAIGTSCILDVNPLSGYKWMTTVIEEIMEEKHGYVKFKTKNSVYELFYKKE